MAFLFRTDGSAVMGLGHVRRCLSLAAVMREPPLFVVRDADESVINLIHKMGYATHKLTGPNESEPEEMAVLQPPAGVLVDLSNRQTLEQFTLFDRNIMRLKKLFPLVAMIDGFGADRLAHRLGWQPNVVFAPYVGALSDGAHYYSGLDYFILSPDYARFIKHGSDIPSVASRVLITCGGADTSAVTSLSLDAINRLRLRLSLRVVIGPAFLPGLKAGIHKLSKTSPHAVELLEAPNSLAAHMAWCHLAIATTGLTKYELAALGTPSIQISPDDHHANTNRRFEDEHTAVHLGVASGISSKQLAQEIDTLIHDPYTRTRLAENSRRLIDGRGAWRVSEILQTFSRENDITFGRNTTGSPA